MHLSSYETCLRHGERKISMDFSGCSGLVIPTCHRKYVRAGDPVLFSSSLCMLEEILLRIVQFCACEAL